VKTKLLRAVLILALMATPLACASREGVKPRVSGVLELSAYELAMKLFNQELTDLQRSELWSEYEGRAIQWTSEFVNAYPATEGITATFDVQFEDYPLQVRIEVVMDERYKTDLLALSEGDLVTYTGILQDFSKAPRMLVAEGAFVAQPRFVPAWGPRDISAGFGLAQFAISGDTLLVLSGASLEAWNPTTGEPIWKIPNLHDLSWYSETRVIGLDSNNVYVAHREEGFLRPDRVVVQTVNIGNGDTAHLVYIEMLLGWGYGADPYIFTTEEVQSIHAKLKERGIVFIPHHAFERTAEFKEITFVAVSGFRRFLKAINTDTQKILWTKRWSNIHGIGAYEDLVYVYVHERDNGNWVARLKAFRMELD